MKCLLLWWTQVCTHWPFKWLTICLFVYFLLFPFMTRYIILQWNTSACFTKERKTRWKWVAISVSVGPTYYSRGPNAAELLTLSVHTPLKELLWHVGKRFRVHACAVVQRNWNLGLALCCTVLNLPPVPLHPLVSHLPSLYSMKNDDRAFSLTKQHCKEQHLNSDIGFLPKWDVLKISVGPVCKTGDSIDSVLKL